MAANVPELAVGSPGSPGTKELDLSTATLASLVSECRKINAANKEIIANIGAFKDKKVITNRSLWLKPCLRGVELTLPVEEEVKVKLGSEVISEWRFDPECKLSPHTDMFNVGLFFDVTTYDDCCLMNDKLLISIERYDECFDETHTKVKVGVGKLLKNFQAIHAQLLVLHQILQGPASILPAASKEFLDYAQHINKSLTLKIDNFGVVVDHGPLLACATENSVEIWRAFHGSGAAERLNSLTGHTAAVTSLCGLPDGRLCSGSDDKSIKLWDIHSLSGTAAGSILGCVATLIGHTNAVKALCVLPGNRVASGGCDTTIRIWSLADYTCVTTLSGHSSNVYTLCSLPDGRLASGSHDNSVRIWDVGSGMTAPYKCLATLSGHTNPIACLCPLPGGRLASGCWDSTIKVWNLGDNGFPLNSCLATLSGHSGQVRGLALSPGGRLLSVSNDTVIKQWNVGVAHGEASAPVKYDCVATLSGHRGHINGVTLLNSEFAVTCSADNSFRLWGTKKLEAAKDTTPDVSTVAYWALSPQTVCAMHP